MGVDFYPFPHFWCGEARKLFSPCIHSLWSVSSRVSHPCCCKWCPAKEGSLLNRRQGHACRLSSELQKTVQRALLMRQPACPWRIWWGQYALLAKTVQYPHQLWVVASTVKLQAWLYSWSFCPPCSSLFESEVFISFSLFPCQYALPMEETMRPQSSHDESSSAPHNYLLLCITSFSSFSGNFLWLLQSQIFTYP